jgi:signal peptidase I
MDSGYGTAVADEQGAASGDAVAGADGGEVSARLAELHRRSEDLAQRVASFRSDTEQATTDAGRVEEPASEAVQEQQPADEPAAGPQPRRHRPRPSADSPLRYDQDAGPAGAATAAATSTATAEPATESQPEAESQPDPEPEAAAQPNPDDGKPEAKVESKVEPESPAKNDDKPKAEPKADKPKEKRPRRGLPGWVRTVRNLVVTVVVIVAAALALRTWVVEPFYVPSASMEPTLHGCPNCNNDHVLVQKIAYYFHDPRRGDIVVFSKPSNWHVNDSDLIKRVIGVPGDKLTLLRGHVFVNGQRLDEPYVNHECRRGTLPETGKSSWKVPKHRLFVMGDNRCDSEDSRQFGMVPISNVVGEAFLTYWPVGRFGSP